MTPEDRTRVDRILDLIVTLARGDLDAQAEQSDAGDELDAITAGLNMLAEELRCREHAMTTGLLERARCMKLEALGTLAGGIAHEFNNILAIILANAESAMLQVGPASSLEGPLQAITTSTLRAAQLVRQLQVYGTDRALVPVSPLDVVREAIAAIGVSLPDGARLVPHLPERCAMVLGDRAQLVQVVVSLCSNAIHALPPAGGVVEIELKCTELPTRVSIHVRDNGCGIAPHIRERMFDPFFTTRTTGRGPGLGLWMVQGIIHDVGGTIEVETTMGAGTTMSMFIPALPAPPQPAAWVPGSVRTSTGRAQRIMLVDDELILLEAYATYLRSEGFGVMQFDRARAAASALDAGLGVDLVVTDNKMPGMSGLELAAHIKRAHPELPIVLLSAYHLRNEEAGASSLFAAVLQKPVMLGELLGTIERCLAATTPGANA